MERLDTRREDAHGGRGPVQRHLAELAGPEEQLRRALVPRRDEGGGLCLQQGFFDIACPASEKFGA